MVPGVKERLTIIRIQFCLPYTLVDLTRLEPAAEPSEAGSLFLGIAEVIKYFGLLLQPQSTLPTNIGVLDVY